MYFTLAIHYPKPGCEAAILDAMRTLQTEAAGRPGLISIGAYVDDDGDRIFATSLWEDQSSGLAAWGELVPTLADVPLDEWERQPREVFMGLRDGLVAA